MPQANYHAYNKEQSLKQLLKRRVRMSRAFPLTALTLTPTGPFSPCFSPSAIVNNYYMGISVSGQDEPNRAL